MSLVNQFREVNFSREGDSLLVTVFNDQEIIGIEILDYEEAHTAEDWYSSLGFGVALETSV